MYLSLLYLKSTRVAKLSAGHIGVDFCKSVVTHRPPLVIKEDLNAPLPGVDSSNEADGNVRVCVCVGGGGAGGVRGSEYVHLINQIIEF